MKDLNSLEPQQIRGPQISSTLLLKYKFKILRILIRLLIICTNVKLNQKSNLVNYSKQQTLNNHRTSWSLNPLVNIHQELKLVVQIESIDKIETCIRIKQETDLNKEFAKKVAMNLFNFMQSFNKNDNTQGDGLLVVPLNTFDKWLDKFMRKYELDPNFVFKSE